TRVRAWPRRVRRDDHVRGQPAGRYADAAARCLPGVRDQPRHGAGDRRAARGRQRRASGRPQAGALVATLSADFELPLRDFELRLALDVERTVALVGPSGAGKTSALRAIAGLVRALGSIALDGDVWLGGGVDLRPEERRVGLVFQEYALFPHLSVRANVAYAGKERADALLERFGIAHLAAARPAELSGGERQRVALARALARDPKVLLLDEPLAALDSRTKTGVRRELQELLNELSIPTILVTHDFED